MIFLNLFELQIVSFPVQLICIERNITIIVFNVVVRIQLEDAKRRGKTRKDARALASKVALVVLRIFYIVYSRQISK